MRPRPSKKGRKAPGRGQIVEYGRDWETPPPELPGRLIREVVIGRRPRKPKASERLEELT